MDRDFIIRAANPAYSTLSGRPPETLVGRYVFDEFPENPEDLSCDGVTRLQESFTRVLRTNAQHNMLIQRYDVQDSGGEFRQRWWTPVNAPVRAAARAVGILHQVQEVTTAHERAQRVLAMLQDRAGRRDGDDDSRHVELATMHLALAHQYSALVDEVAGLRQALTSRATIDQAKGALMAQHGCEPEQAFRLLVRLSQDTNVPLADVARAVIYQTRSTTHRDAESQVANTQGP